MSGHEGIFKTAVLKTKDQASVQCFGRLHLCDARHPRLHATKHRLKLVAMVLVKVLRDQRQIVALRGKVLRVPELLAGSSVGDMKVRKVPTFDQFAKRTHDRKALKL